MHVVQRTPTGSGCSIVIGDLPSQSQMAPGSLLIPLEHRGRFRA